MAHIITKILKLIKKDFIFFATLTKNGYNFDSFIPMAVVVLAVVFFLFDNIREKRSLPLTSQVLHVLKILVAYPFKIGI